MLKVGLVCLPAFCEELPTLARWLLEGPAFREGLKWEQGTDVRSTGP